ncbi:MAG: type II secretion system F family protein, partial [Limisphaerales bacterium]
MPSFAYVARDSTSGREINSVIDASSESNAVATLLNRNLLVVSIQEKISKKGKSAGGSVPLADLVMFTRQLATMIDAGLAMVQSLQALAEQSTNKMMREVIKDISSRVVSGD